MFHLYRFTSSLMVLLVMSASTARASKAPHAGGSLEGVPVQAIRLGTPNSLSPNAAECDMGELRAPAWHQPYLTPPNDRYFVLLKNSQCAGAANEADIYLWFDAPCSVDAFVSIVGAAGSASCRVPDEGQVLCSPGNWHMFVTPGSTTPGLFLFQIPLPGCCLSQDAFLDVDFQGSADCPTQLPQLIGTGPPCNSCQSWNFYSPNIQDDLCNNPLGGWPSGNAGNLAMFVKTKPTPTGTPAWTELPSGVRRRSHTAIYDPLRDQIVIFGGNDPSMRNDTRALILSGPPTWMELAPSGTRPSARWDHAAIYDPVRDRMVIFGGYDGSDRNDVWALSLSGTPTWTQLVPSGTPPAARSLHSAIYDPVRDQMVIFGGYHSGALNDTWALTLSGTPTWIQVTASPPPVRGGHSAIYDPVRDQMVIFSGFFAGNDTWALTLAGTPTWTQLAPSGTQPTARRGHKAIYDPVRDRMVIFGGLDNNNANIRNDAWALSLSETPAWTQLAPSCTAPPARYLHTANYDPPRDRMIVYGGDNNSGLILSDTWGLTWGTPLGVPSWSEIMTFALEAVTPNPTGGAMRIAFRAAHGGHVRVSLLDIQGRIVARLADGWYPAGRSELTWTGAGALREASPGVYFVRLEAGGRILAKRFIVIR